MTSNRFDFPKVQFRQPISVSVEDGFRVFRGQKQRHRQTWAPKCLIPRSVPPSTLPAETLCFQ